MMNAGQLRYKIKVIEEKITINDRGFKETVTEELGSFRAKVEHLNTKEIYRLEKINLKVSIKFTVRNIRKILNEKQKVIYNNQQYKISYLEEVFNDSKYLTIYCEKIEGK